MRHAASILLTEDESSRLIALSTGRRVSVRMNERAKIVLLASEGLENIEIASRLGITRQKAARWRDRYAESGLRGIEQDAPRLGRNRSIDKAIIKEVVRKTLEEKPDNATHWSRSRMSAATGLSDSTIGRIWKSHGLKPHLISTFKLSNDKQFADKEVHIICDNYATHKHAKVKAWQKRNKRFHFHFPPISASWLNMVERFFRDITENQIRRGVFKSLPGLIGRSRSAC